MRISHTIDPLDRISIDGMRAAVASMKGSVTGPSSREAFDKLMEQTPSADGVIYESAEVGGVPGWWCTPDGSVTTAAILYLHGGAYLVGSLRAYRYFAGQVAARANVAAFVPEYRLAPEHLFPAAVDDAQASYRGLVEQGFSTIALALLSLLAGNAGNSSWLLPVGAAVMSPWTDLMLSWTSMETRSAADPLLTKDSLSATAELYLRRDGLAAPDPRDPRASPLFGDLAELPPVRIHVGEDEVLLDDSPRYADRLESGGERFKSTLGRHDLCVSFERRTPALPQGSSRRYRRLSSATILH